MGERYCQGCHEAGEGSEASVERFTSSLRSVTRRSPIKRPTDTSDYLAVFHVAAE